MPVQRLFGNAGAARGGNPPARPAGQTLAADRTYRRAGLAASSEVRVAFSRDGLDVVEVVLLLFFVPLFSWVAFGFVSSTIGFVQLISGAHPGFVPVPSPAASLAHRTAVLMPVYNEDVDAVFARVEAMAYAIDRAGGRAGSISSCSAVQRAALASAKKRHGRTGCARRSPSTIAAANRTSRASRAISPMGPPLGAAGCAGARCRQRDDRGGHRRPGFDHGSGPRSACCKPCR
jgi:membrane glycosyltransferase